MSFKKTLIIFSAIFGVFVAGALLGIFLVDIGYVQVREDRLAERNSNGIDKDIVVDLTVDYGNGDVQSFPGERIREGNSVYDLLQVIEQRHGISIETRNFPGLGVFIEAIHGVHSTNQSYWQFWVNGEYAQVGAAQYVLEDGDEVLWKRTSERPK